MAIVYIIALLPDHKSNSPKPNSHNTENNNTQSINNNTNYESISDNDFNPSSSSSSRSSQFVVGFKVFFRGLSDAFSATFRRRAAGVRLAIVALLLADFFIAIVFAGELFNFFGIVIDWIVDVFDSFFIFLFVILYHDIFFFNWSIDWFVWSNFFFVILLFFCNVEARLFAFLF